MNTYFLKNLARHIVSVGVVKKTEAKKLVELLTAEQLRKLMQLIALEEEKATAYVTSADELSKNESDLVKTLFKDKKIVSITDSNIGAGIKAQVYDMIYDLSVRSKVQNIAHKLEEEI